MQKKVGGLVRGEGVRSGELRSGGTGVCVRRIEIFVKMEKRVEGGGGVGRGWGGGWLVAR